MASQLAVTAPDLFGCDPWYSLSKPGMPKLDDCVAAINMLPVGAQPTEWIKDPDGPRVPNDLPLTVRSGTCEIIFDLSGPAAEQTWPSPIMFVPNDIRDMANVVKTNCLQAKGTGGFVTQGLSNSTNYVNDPSAPWGQLDPFPLSTSYFSLWIWIDIDSTDPWNAGNNDYHVGSQIEQELVQAYKQFSRDSRERFELVRRADILAITVGAMFYGLPRPEYQYINWFDLHFSSTTSTGNATNSSSSSVTSTMNPTSVPSLSAGDANGNVLTLCQRADGLEDHCGSLAYTQS